MNERAQLVVLALAAELTFLVVVMVPLLPLIAVQVFFWGPVFASWVGLAALLGMWWIVQPDRSHDATGPAPSPEAPLSKALADLCSSINAPPIHKIVLTDELNAAAYQSRGFFSLLGVRRTLFLGIPLLRLLTEDEARAVVAHELGHFSRQHGKMGHWVYLVRSKWDAYLFGDLREDNFVDITLKSIASRFVPFFLNRSSSWSKRCEFEADAVAAQAVAAESLARALAKLDVLSFLMQSALRKELNAARLQMPEPPDDFWNFVAGAAARSTRQDYEQALAQSGRRPSRLHDTHPPTTERFQALQVAPPSPEWDFSPCAGEMLLGRQWEAVYADCNARWQDKAALRWRSDHLRLSWLAASAASQEGTEASHDELAQLRDQAIAAEQFSPSPQSLERLRTLAERYPDDALARFGYGCALLDREETQGITEIRQAIKQDRRLALNGHSLVCAFLEACGTDEEVAAARKRLRNALAAMDFIDRKLWEQLMTGNLEALSVSSRSLLQQTLSHQSYIDGCWVVKTAIADRKGLAYPINILVARLDLSKLAGGAAAEDKVRARLAEDLRAVTAANEHVRVHTLYTIEPLNPHLLKQLQTTQNACLRHPVSAINADIIKIDSL